jgi:hypothetical protein
VANAASREPARCAIFAYGSLAHPTTIRQLSGDAVRGANYVIVDLDNWRRSWTVCTDNTDLSRAVAYYRPGTLDRIDGQILFLNLRRDPGSTIRGALLLVPSAVLGPLDEREKNYDRIDVTADIDLSGVPSDLRPDVVWTYVGNESAVLAAARGTARRSAVIWRPYLDRLYDAFAHHDDLLEIFRNEPLPADVRVVDLDRRMRDKPTDPYADPPP